jgi:hypothetical protein
MNYFSCALLALCMQVTLAPAAEQTEWLVGTAKADITPSGPIWMAGYASRTKPCEGVAQKLYTRVLALQDQKGHRLVIIGCDILGMPATLVETISQDLGIRYGLKRPQMLFTFSHTHSGPVIRESLTLIYELNSEQSHAVNQYILLIWKKIADAVDAALQDMKPAALYTTTAQADFGVNRRQATEAGVKIGVNENGPVDHSVPVLKIVDADNTVRAILFSYACHNTTLTGNNYLIHGDYAGVAEAQLEEKYPGAVALFMAGFAGDTNPNPRGTMALVTQHGTTLATAVQTALAGEALPVSGPLRSSFKYVKLPFSTPPTRQELEAKLQDKDKYVQRNAQGLLDRLNSKGKLPKHYDYPIEVVQWGQDLTLVALAGEVLVDYAVRLREEIPPAEKLWLVGYSNDVFAYIPSQRVMEEGGYEPESSMIYYGLWPWSMAIEEILVKQVKSQVDKLR